MKRSFTVSPKKAISAATKYSDNLDVYTVEILEPTDRNNPGDLVEIVAESSEQAISEATGGSLECGQIVKISPYIETPVEGATSTRDRISMLEEKLENIRHELQIADLSDEERIDLLLDAEEVEEQLNFAWQDDESEYNYAVNSQEFNPDGSLKNY